VQTPASLGPDPFASVPDYAPAGLAAEIFSKRYALHRDESWTEACERVGSHVATAESGELVIRYREEFSGLLRKNLFVPGGRIMYGSGRPKGQLMNCFVIGTDDSREGWGKTTSDMIVICGTGGGLGVNASPIRPRGTPISGTGGHATGSVSLFEILNAAGEVIKAGGGRRTALMFALGLSHGDIEEFLDKKLDLKQLTNANVSVWFDENPEIFFAAVKAGEDLHLKFRGKIIGSVPARKIWDKIIANALKSGEPGMLNGYLFNKMSNISYHAPIVCTNPCQPATATVLTPEGVRRFADIDVGSTIWSGRRWTRVIRKEMTGIKPVKLYRTRAGQFLGTENHKVLQNGAKIPVGEATTIDWAVGPTPEATALDPQDIMDGMVLGDGTTHRASNDLTVLIIGQNDEDYHASEIKHLIGANRDGLKPKAWEVRTTLGPLPKTFERRVPERFARGCAREVRGFLRGLYSANGSVTGGRVTLKAASLPIIETVQHMLSSLGIRSYYTVNQANVVDFSNGSYECRESYDLNIGTAECRKIFRDLIGFVQKYKTERLDETLSRGPSCKPLKLSYEIVDVEERGDMPVYSITVDDPEHTYWTGGLHVANCGEIGLIANDVCCLGALVLPRFADPVDGGDLDFPMLRAAVRLAVRFLDNVISVNNYPLPAIQATANDIRRIGLGVMGLHDMLLLLGLKYSSARGLEMVEKVMSFIKVAAYEASIELSKEKGAFPRFQAEPFLRGGFAKTLKPTLRAQIREHGIRNCALLTIAPTGTTSMVSGVTSGIEPMFAPAYRRRFRDGDALREEIVIHPLLKRFIDEGRSAKHFQGAFDLSLRNHFEIQAAAQKHLDNACSKTINLPQGTSAEELSDLYMEFFPELKGITVYPDGSREDQPLTPISLDEAVKLAKEAKAEASEGRCRSGVCEI